MITLKFLPAFHTVYLFWSLHLYLNIAKKIWFEVLRLQVVLKSSLKEPDLEMFWNTFISHLMELHEISLRFFLK